MLRKKSLYIYAALLLMCAVAVAQTSNIPSGTEIKVRTDEQVVATPADEGHHFAGTVSEEVRDASGNTVIPKGARAELTALKDGDKVALDLSSVNVDGREYQIDSKSYKEGSVGANKTTAKYAGGGALAGTVIGAIAGGGKGALIGAIAGGAAGAGAQVLTKGKKIDLPAETELTFKTASELSLEPVAPGSRR
jgi:hypothetical protein